MVAVTILTDLNFPSGREGRGFIHLTRHGYPPLSPSLPPAGKAGQDLDFLITGKKGRVKENLAREVKANVTPGKGNLHGMCPVRLHGLREV
jgi:hypothetical protein